MKDYNADERVHGILVQLPLPSHLNEQTVLDAIDFEKDVDGFHPMNIGLLALKADPRFLCLAHPKYVEVIQMTKKTMLGGVHGTLGSIQY